jgi:crotonobetainyl-CoA:carnitine CoA-transferase CaiB-like acyl-CoA transferase
MIERSLNGIRIVDLSMGWAGPLAARQLADMGADVIKVESCERFDWWRSWEATPEWIEDNGAEKSSAFNMVNRNKRAITLDLEDTDGRDLLLRLVRTAHAVVENFSGGVLPKLNLDYETFKRVNEKIILLSMPAFGSTGPWRNFRAYGSTVEQASGLPHLNGLAQDPPTMHHVAYGDAVGGLNGAAALLVALRHQARSGEGQFVDLSQVEALFPLAAHGIMHFSATQSELPRTGNQTAEAAPHGVYACAGDDEWIVIQIYNDEQWQALRQQASPYLNAITDRLAQHKALDQAIGAWTENKNAHQLMRTLQAKHIPAAATHKASTLLNDEHLAERGYWQWMNRAVVGNQPNPSAPFRASNVAVELTSPAPTMGEHNHEVLVEELEISEQEFERLMGRGVIGNRPRMPSRKR